MQSLYERRTGRSSPRSSPRKGSVLFGEVVVVLFVRCVVGDDPRPTPCGTAEKNYRRTDAELHEVSEHRGPSDTNVLV